MEQQADELFELSRASWSEIEDELTDALKTSAKFGPRKGILRIGENNVSGIRMVTIMPKILGVQAMQASFDLVTVDIIPDHSFIHSIIGLYK